MHQANQRLLRPITKFAGTDRALFSGLLHRSTLVSVTQVEQQMAQRSETAGGGLTLHGGV